MYDLGSSDLQVILAAVKHNKSGNKKVLRKRVLNLLSGPSSKTRFLRQKILQVFNARSEQNMQPRLQQPLSNEILHHSRFSPQVLQLPPPINPSYVIPDLHYETPTVSYQILPSASSAEFENLPFYKTMHILLKPMDCVPPHPEPCFGTFVLTNNIIHEISKSWDSTKEEYKTQIILRIVPREPKENVTERLPYNISVSVNNRPCKLPAMNIPTKAGITPWRCNVPIDITHQTYLKHIKNVLSMVWSGDSELYKAAVYVAQKLTWNDLLIELKKRSVRSSDITKEFIKKSLENDADMGVDYVIGTLTDPLSKRRMELPARGVNCIHMPCFDAIQFLQMNEQKQTWLCPICKKKVRFEDIEIDEFFLNILQSPNLSNECENVIFLADGTWCEKKPKNLSNISKIDDRSSNHIEVFTLSDSDDDNNYINQSETKRRKLTSPKVGESIIKSEHTSQIEDLTRTNDNNSTENNFVLDLSLKNNSSPSTNSNCSKYDPIITLNDDSDTQSFTELSSYYLPNISISKCSKKESKPSSSENSNNKKRLEIDKSRPVLCVITLD